MANASRAVAVWVWSVVKLVVRWRQSQCHFAKSVLTCTVRATLPDSPRPRASEVHEHASNGCILMIMSHLAVSSHQKRTASKRAEYKFIDNYNKLQPRAAGSPAAGAVPYGRYS